MEISTEKSETMAFLEKTQSDVKMVWITNGVDNKWRGLQMVWITNGVDYKCLQQVNNFKYLGRKISYEN
jgi:hypothetical protein